MNSTVDIPLTKVFVDNKHLGLESGCWALWRLKDIAGQSSIRWDGSPKNNFELLEHIK